MEEMSKGVVDHFYFEGREDYISNGSILLTRGVTIARGKQLVELN